VNWASPVSQILSHKAITNSPRSQEQAYEDHPNHTIGSETNIWAIGAVICYLITNLKISSKAFIWQCQGATNPFWTQGKGLLDPYYGIYSRTLIDTIFMCLAYDPAANHGCRTSQNHKSCRRYIPRNVRWSRYRRRSIEKWRST
jgi:hypothetical protein